MVIEPDSGTTGRSEVAVAGGSKVLALTAAVLLEVGKAGVAVAAWYHRSQVG